MYLHAPHKDLFNSMPPWPPEIKGSFYLNSVSSRSMSLGPWRFMEIISLEFYRRRSWTVDDNTKLAIRRGAKNWSHHFVLSLTNKKITNMFNSPFHSHSPSCSTNTSNSAIESENTTFLPVLSYASSPADLYHPSIAKIFILCSIACYLRNGLGFRRCGNCLWRVIRLLRGSGMGGWGMGMGFCMLMGVVGCLIWGGVVVDSL